MFTPESIEETRFTLDAFNSYLGKIEDYLLDEQEQIEILMSSIHAKGGSEESGINATKDFTRIKTFENIFYSSFIISLHSYLESRLNYFCRYLQKVNHYPLELNDLNGKGIPRTKIYMDKICKIKTPSDSTWEEVETLNAVRNCIVHGAGEVTNEQLLKYIKKQKDKLRLWEDATGTQHIAVGHHYSEHAIGLARKYLEHIFTENY